MRLQTIDHIMNPTLGQTSQWISLVRKSKSWRPVAPNIEQRKSIFFNLIIMCPFGFNTIDPIAYSRWGQAILSKDEAIFGKIKGSTKTFGEVRHGDNILTPLPDEEDVQLKLDRLLQSQAGRPCGSSGPSH